MMRYLNLYPTVTK